MTYCGFKSFLKEVFNFAFENKEIVENLLGTNKNFIEMIKPTYIHKKLEIIVSNHNKNLTIIFAGNGHLDCLRYAGEKCCL